MIARAFEENVQRIFIPNVDQHTVNGMMDIVAAHPQKCFPMMGLFASKRKELANADNVIKILRGTPYESTTGRQSYKLVNLHDLILRIAALTPVAMECSTR